MSEIFWWEKKLSSLAKKKTAKRKISIKGITKKLTKSPELEQSNRG